jgi:hypothetical protein
LFGLKIDNDLHDIADNIVERINEFIDQRQWICPDICVVNQQRAAEDGFAEWNLGLNLDLPDPHQEPPGWFEDVKAIVSFCVNARKKHHHDFVFGISDNDRGIAEDIIDIDSDEPDVEYIKSFIGIEPPKKENTEQNL